MENMKGSSNIRDAIYNGKHSLLPPKCPFPIVSPSYVDHVPSPATGPKGIAKPREVKSRHHRTSSESLLMEEQPSWLDELLNEPETPVRKAGHRRSSSDSFAYIDVDTVSTIDYIAQDEHKYKNMSSVPSWGSHDFEHYKDVGHASFYKEPTSLGKQTNWDWDPSGLLSATDNGIVPSRCVLQDADGLPFTGTEKQDPFESGPHDSKAASEWKDYSHANSSASETDTKRAKQQFAQRSRVRKLQYIAELESNVQALQAEGSEISADLEFRNQQNLILTLENKALKQRLESLAQEKLIKYLEHEVLEREIGRLRAVHQQQQQHPASSHRRTKSKDFDLKFANLSLKHKDPSSGRDPVSGSLHIRAYEN